MQPAITRTVAAVAADTHSLVCRVESPGSAAETWQALAAPGGGPLWTVQSGGPADGPAAARIRAAERGRALAAGTPLRAVMLCHVDRTELVLVADRTAVPPCCLTALAESAASADPRRWGTHRGAPGDHGDGGPVRAARAGRITMLVGPVSAPLPATEPVALATEVGVLYAAATRQESVVVAVGEQRLLVSSTGAVAAASGGDPQAAVLATDLAETVYWPVHAPTHPVTVVQHRTGDGRATVRTAVDTGQLDAGLGEVIATHLPRRLAAGAGGPGRPFPLEPAEITGILRAGVTAATAAVTSGTVHDTVVRTARRQPDRVAVSDGATDLTYGELERLSAAAAAGLVERGLVPGDHVGVHMDRSSSAIVALLAVMRAGGVYVPLDVTHPAARRDFVIGDAGLRFVVTDAGNPAALEGVTTVAVETLLAEDARGDVKLPVVDPEQAAYIIYTSGTTGRPKGVLVPHRNVLALIDATRDELALGPSDVWTVFHSFAFDFSVWEVWGALMTGGKLVVVSYWTARTPAELARLLRDQRVTVFSQTPSAFATVIPAVLADHAPLDVRLVVFGGEALRTPILADWLRRYPASHCRLVNMYGITETTVHVTWHDVTASDVVTQSRSVGRALPGWSVSVRSAQGAVLPFHVAGEICVGGAGLALGYHHRAELTAERFPTDPVTGQRYYRSGDLGRLRPDGTLEHLGRIDDQVKIRGYRVELGEIRSALLADAAVKDAAVTFRDDDGGTVLAYAVAPPTVSAADVRRRLAGRLPEYMIPSVLLIVAALPLTPNGKVDLAALVGAGAPDEPPPVAVTGQGLPDAASAVNLVWREVFGAGCEDEDFFSLGGSSLLALRISNALTDLGYPSVDPREVYLNPSVADLVAYLEASPAD
ncbi:non-ribosomal peptide synthetase [Catellatospora methionotrophica]|uniref:non-ribosomal peptide synthetase n=1 Tax=Catellatospora methionotrophica TaxID=121620 RepID=UPI003405D676